MAVHTEDTFHVVVNAEPTAVHIDTNLPLSELVNEAVRKTENEAGHALSDWEVRDQKGGQPLDQSRPIKDYAFAKGITLYVDLKVGGGG